VLNAKKENEVTSFVPQTGRMVQSYSLSPCLLKTFINFIMEYIHINDSHALLIEGTTAPGLLFTYDLGLSSFTVSGL
jgi:hypothetical protein